MTVEVLDGSIQYLERGLRAELEAVTRQLEEARATAQQQAIEIARLVGLVWRLKLQRDEANDARRIAEGQASELMNALPRVGCGCSFCLSLRAMAARKLPVHP